MKTIYKALLYLIIIGVFNHNSFAQGSDTLVIVKVVAIDVGNTGRYNAIEVEFNQPINDAEINSNKGDWYLSENSDVSPDDQIDYFDTKVEYIANSDLANDKFIRLGINSPDSDMPNNTFDNLYIEYNGGNDVHAYYTPAEYLVDTISTPSKPFIALDYAGPKITAVTFTPNNGNTLGINDTLILTISTYGSETGLSADTLIINNTYVPADSLKEIGGGVYTFEYIISEGDNNIDDGTEVIPINIVLSDANGNLSIPYTLSTNCPGIDANRPSISNVSFTPGSGTIVGIGGAINVIITSNNLETDLSANSIIINGVTIPNGDVVNEGGGTYSFTYNIDALDANVLDSDPILIDFKLEDAVGNISASYTLSTAAKCPGIDVVVPVISNLVLSTTSGTLGIGDTVIFTLTASEAGLVPSTISINSKDLKNKFTDIGGGDYEIEYIIKSGDNSVNDLTQAIPVSLILSDAAGNPSSEYNTLSIINSPGIDAIRPGILNVTSIPSTIDTLIIGESLTFTVDIDVDDATLTIIPAQYNGQNLNWITHDLGSTYEGVYTVTVGDQDRGTPLQLIGVTATDPAGNKSNVFNGTDVVVSIDANKPSVSEVSFSPGSGTIVGMGGSIDVLITANDLEPDLSANSIIINGVTISNGDVVNLGDGTYSFTYNIGALDASVLDSDPILIDFIFEDAAGNISASYTSSTAAKCPGIDNAAPSISSLALSVMSGTMGIGDTIIFTLTASEEDLLPSTIIINSKDLKSKFVEIGGGDYEIEYVIKSGDNSIDDLSQAIPVSFILTDAAGNLSAEFNTLSVLNSPGIDAVKPVISYVNVTPVTMLYNQTYTVDITVGSDGGDNYILESGTIAGFNFHTLTRNSSTSYSLSFTVNNLGYDILPEDSYSISNLVFSDRGGNFSSAYSAIVAQGGDPIYTILPTAKVTGKRYVCDGDEADLLFQLTGNAPWSVELYDGTGTTTVSGINESPFTYSVEQNLSVSTEPDTIVYKITEVTDVNGNVKIMTGIDSSTVYVRNLPVVNFVNPAGDKTYNINAPQDSLTGTPSSALGGVFSGDGVIPSNNKFSPSAAGLGAHEIDYNYTDPVSGCYASDKVTLTVIASNASISIDDGDYWRCDYETTFDITAGVVDKAWIIGELKLHNVPVATGAITDHGDNTATIDVQKLSAGTYTIYYVYNDGGLDSVSNSFTVESVGKPNFTELNDVCEDYETINVTAYNLIPTDGTGQYTFSGAVGAFVSNASDDNNSGYFAPGLITPGNYTLEYIYTSPNGCESEMVPKSFNVNELPDVYFALGTDSVYNIEQGPIIITGIPTDAGGEFTSSLEFIDDNEDGTAVIDPDENDLGSRWIKYTYTNANGCVNNKNLNIKVNKPLGDITSSSGGFQFCYDGSVETFTGIPNPTDDSPGSFYIDNVPVTTIDNKMSFIPQDYLAGYHQLKFKYDSASTSYEVIKSINIDSIGNIYFTGLDAKYCKNENVEIKLTAFYPGQNGLMKFSGNGITDDTVDELGYFNPSKADLGDNTITYNFTRDYSGCQKAYSESVTINRTPIVAFSPNERCIVNSNDLLGFKAVEYPEDSISKWTWLLKNQIQSNDTFPTFPVVPGTYNSMRLTLETNKGCSHYVDSTFYIGTRVDLQFSFENECNGEVSEFNVNVSSNPDDVSYVNWDFGGPGISDLSDSLNPTHKYLNPGGYEVIYEEFTKSCGRIADTLKIVIRPSIDLSTGEYIADFEDNPDISGWVIEDFNTGVNNPWEWGEPDGEKIYSAASGNNAFGTNLTGNYANNEKGMVTSPCFDFSSLQRPMMKMDFIADLEPDRDGVVMQFSKANGDWATIGVPNDGINWYNSYIIGGAPADQQLGWTGEYLSSENSGWQTAMYRLDELRGRAGVRFRIVFGSDLAGDNYEGFAFDNIQFGERKRMVLLENFTNSTNDKANNTQENIINPILEKDSLDVISLNYHTSFPLANDFNSFYPSGPSARALFYGVSGIPYSVLDGGERNYDYTLTNTLIESDIHKRMLIDPQFNIFVHQGIQNGNLVVSSTIEAVKELSSQNVLVFVAIVEKTVLVGSDTYHNVLRTMLPDAAGKLIEKDWMIGDEFAIYHTWSIPENVNDDSLISVVFVQDERTKDIYQTAYTSEYSTITDIEDILLNTESYNNYQIYPNPVSEVLSVKFNESFNYDIIINIYNSVGSLVKTNHLVRGDELLEFDTNDLPAGVYYLRLTNVDDTYSTKKFIKTE